MAVMLFNVFAEPTTSVGAAAAQENSAPSLAPPDPDAFASPYDDYVVTQGPHGYSYGHMAIDLTAGEDATIKSPINGEVVDYFIDQWGNPNLVIENERYRVSLLHGLYSVSVGQSVTLGEPVGTESNQGYTIDYLGRSCAGRDCGYHTHLNVFDKGQGVNVNPLDLFDR